MCQTCSGNGLLYKNEGIGISVERCPDCHIDYDPCAELRERIERFKEEQGIA